MTEDRVERLIHAALGRNDAVRAPEGFADRVGERLHFARLLERQRERVRRAWATALGGILALAGVMAGAAAAAIAWTGLRLYFRRARVRR